MNINEQQFSLLIKEGYLASSSIGYGLSSLRRAGTHLKGEYYQAFFQLSIGLERLMKLIIIQYHRGKNNSFPNNKILKNYGHDLFKLYQTIINLETTQELIIDTSEVSMKILLFLSEFSKSSRYYNLDTLTGRQHTVDPLIKWIEIQELILKKHPKRKNSKSIYNQEFARFFNESSAVIVFDERNKLFKNVEEFLNKMELDEYIQGYAVYYTYLLISPLTKRLGEIELEFYLYPHLREFFSIFNGGFSKYEIRKKKNWINIGS